MIQFLPFYNNPFSNLNRILAFFIILSSSRFFFSFFFFFWVSFFVFTSINLTTKSRLWCRVIYKFLQLQICSLFFLIISDFLIFRFNHFLKFCFYLFELIYFLSFYFCFFWFFKYFFRSYFYFFRFFNVFFQDLKHYFLTFMIYFSYTLTPFFFFSILLKYFISVCSFSCFINNWFHCFISMCCKKNVKKIESLGYFGWLFSNFNIIHEFSDLQKISRFYELDKSWV